MSQNEPLHECFELQLSEVEMLKSMYPKSTEFCISLPTVLADMDSFLTGKTRELPNLLDFSLNLEIPDFKEKLEINIVLPHTYPYDKPEVSARSVCLNRSQHHELNCALRNYLKSIPEGDLCVLPLVTWISENASSFASFKSEAIEDVETETASEDNFTRMWIYSHHIYNKFKRRDIVDMGHDLNLTGFSLPGKPGLICIEGLKSNCNEFFQRIKQMSWKKLSLVKEETDHETRFDSFQEISFQVRRGPAKEYHMDMGQFLKFLEEHNCGYAFQDLFGLEGHTAEEKK
ncbi:RWD domain-containing protein 2A-like [Uloborus diversus]|uniref:RWD domain-containing protein 2A-like n=1 Tax=Uloborus diversus TaxID=327109 RepID=UPI00240A5662|nr:RWD domain-containing protein 2A-like [Uloborus diversus]